MKGNKRRTITSLPAAGVPVRVLKDRLSELLRAVESGSTVVVTSHGRALADLVPHREGATLAAPLIVRQPSRPWGSVQRRPGRGRTGSTALLLEDRRRR